MLDSNFQRAFAAHLAEERPQRFCEGIGLKAVADRFLVRDHLYHIPRAEDSPNSATPLGRERRRVSRQSLLAVARREDAKEKRE